ncbi:PDZ domain-containing protein [Flavobacterium sp.]
MQRPLLLFCFLLFTIVAYPQSGFQIQKGKSKVVIPFKLIDNLIFIPLTLNGEQLTFLLDTGVEESILFSLSEENQVALNDVEVIKLKGLGSSDAITGYKSSKNEVAVKQFVDTNHTIYIVLDQEFNFSSHVGIAVNGILGYHFFKNHLIEIDYTRQKIYVYAKDHKINRTLQKKYSKDSITLEMNKPYVFKNISNQRTTTRSKLLLDTGNSDAVWVFNNEKVKIPLGNNSIDDFLGRGFNGNIYGKRSRIDSISFGGHLFKDALTNFPDTLSTQSVSFVDHRVGSIGGEILSRFTILFDYPNRLIYTQPNAMINDPFNFNMSGIEVEHAGLEWKQQERMAVNDGIRVYENSSGSTSSTGRTSSLKTQFTLISVFKILSIRPNSEAEKAGLKVGDRILTLNNQKADGLTIQKIHQILKSGEGRAIKIVVDRNGIELTVKFELKKML